MHEVLSGTSIRGIGVCVPKSVVYSKDLSFDSPAESHTFINKIGVSQKRVSGGEYTSADLCLRAADSIMRSLDWSSSSIDLLVSVTQSPDYTVPGNAYVIHSELQLSGTCMLLDINAGCTGWVQGLIQCLSLINTYKFNRVLLISGETNILSHASEKDSYRLMGDVGTATAIEGTLEQLRYFFSIKNLGSFYRLLYAPDSGAVFLKNHITEQNPSKRKILYDHTIKMDGALLQTFISKEVFTSIQEFIKQCSFIPDKYFLHQPNKLHFDYLIKKLGLNSEKTPSIITEFGNVSSACIPLTIHKAFQNETAFPMKVSCHAFGVGLSIANIAFDLPRISCPVMEEL